MREFEARVGQVDGLYGQRHAKLIYGLIRSLQPRYLLEIGSWQGYTSCWMAKAIQDNGFGHLYLMDDFSLPGSSASVLHNNLVLCGVANVCTICEGTSSRANWPESVDFAFVDGDHSYTGCMNDLNACFAHGAECICVHDSFSWAGVAQAVSQMKSENPELTVMEFQYDQGLAVILKDRPRPNPIYPDVNQGTP